MAKLVLSDLDFNSVSKINNLPNATLAQQPVTFSQLNTAIEGLQDKGVAVAAASSNINIASPGATIDGVAMAVNDLFLLIGQTAPAENGLYVYNGAAVVATRSANMNLSSEFNNALVNISGGTASGITYRQTALSPTVGTTAIAFIVFGSIVPSASETVQGKIEIATQAETNTGTDDTRAITPLKLASYTGFTKKFASLFGDAAATQYDITHNFNSNDCQVDVYVVATGESVLCDMKRQTVNSVRLNFSSAPALNSLRCVVVS